MTTSNAFKKCDGFTSRWEGGDVDHPGDRGGRTSRGVTQRRYDQARDDWDLPRRDVFLMTEAEREAIYATGYWDPIHGDELPEGVNLVVYDGGVNSGPGTSVRWLQSAMGFRGADVDGQIGPKSLGKLRSSSAIDVVKKQTANRRSFLRRIGKRMNHNTGKTQWEMFGTGWSRRVNDVEARGVAWAAAAMPGVSVKDVLRKEASASTASGARSKDAGKATGAAGTAGGGFYGLESGDVIVPLIFAGALLIVALVLHRRGVFQLDRARAFVDVLQERLG